MWWWEGRWGGWKEAGIEVMTTIDPPAHSIYRCHTDDPPSPMTSALPPGGPPLPPVDPPIYVYSHTYR